MAQTDKNLSLATRPKVLFPFFLLLKTTPNALHGMVAAQLFNILAGAKALTGRAETLQGRRIGIVVTDTGNQWCFLIVEDRLRSIRGDVSQCEVRIRGTLADFMRLAMRIEDPDTLFFHRRLIIEGATETGLAIKNLLDSLEFDWQDRLSTVLGPTLTGRLSDLVTRSGAPQRAHRILERMLTPSA